jgi:hypothetical protein
MGQSRKMVSAFDDNESYELTQLGQQFVHYAMTDIPPKIEFKPETFASGFRSNTQFHSENPRHV